MVEFANKVVMITGACGGLGNVIARRFATTGATLILSDRDETRMQKLIDELGTQHLGIVIDLGNPDDLQQAMQQINDANLKIDIMIHTVGGYSGGHPLHESDVSELQKQIFLNTQTVFVSCGAVAGHMVENGNGGSIIITLSKVANKGAKNFAAHSASKAAAKSLVESMSAELATHNIRVNGISPGIIDTPANREAMPNADFSQWVTPDDIADVMMFLAGDGSKHISGVNVPVG